ncbi:MAG: hypothetical protein NT079_02185 [Candidatus Omnitrophica bacterium]|nr:hypothetical protein [Candidatus Omnitrophota bacterium]
MYIQENWEKALSHTEIVRPRIKNLLTFDDTKVPYILLSASSVNLGDTVVRKGDVTVTRPSLILPPNIPQLDGFKFEEDGASQDGIVNFLMVRGVSIPSLKYDNHTYSVDVHEDNLDNATAFYKEYLQRREDVQDHKTDHAFLINP